MWSQTWQNSLEGISLRTVESFEDGVQDSPTQGAWVGVVCMKSNEIRMSAPGGESLWGGGGGSGNLHLEHATCCLFSLPKSQNGSSQA